MKIPKTVKIGALTYSVRLVADMDESGKTDNKDLVITLRGNSKPEAIELTFIHELLHAINFEIEDEERVEYFAQGLYQIIKDNPNIFI